MTPEERAALLDQSDRHLRRGDLAAALQALETIVSALPEDEVARSRLSALKENLLPGEAQVTRAPRESTQEHEAQQSPEAYAERCVVEGRYAEALATYRQLLGQRPDNELIRDRLSEIYRLAQATEPPVQRARPGPPAEPEDLVEVLKLWLKRIEARRRKLPAS